MPRSSFLRVCLASLFAPMRSTYLLNLRFLLDYFPQLGGANRLVVVYGRRQDHCSMTELQQRVASPGEGEGGRGRVSFGL